MTIYITGVTGFIGGALANHFIAKGFHVIGTGRSKQLPNHVNNACEYISQDITKPMQPIVADIVIHTAAITADTALADKVYNTNTLGTINVIVACTDVRKFIQVSTSSVYPFNENKAYKETEAGTFFDTLSPYGKTKFMAEQEVLKADKFPQKFILRPRAVYGVGDTALLPRLLRFVKGNKLFLPATITKQISLTHIDSFVKAVDLCVNNSTQKIGIYNIADEKPYCLQTCIHQLTAAATNKPLKIVLIPSIIWNAILQINSLVKFIPQLTKFGSKQLTNTAVMDIEKAIIELSYKPTQNFKEVALATGHWYRGL